jgi:hypothetical protein
MLVLNPSTPDEAVARVAAMPQDKIVEIIAQNQLRLLRHDPIVRALVANPAVRPSTVDGITDFCVRSGLVLADMPAFQAARKRVLGAGVDEREAAEAAAKAALEEASAEEALEQVGATAQGDETPEEPKDDEELDADGKRKRLSIQQQIAKLSIAKKIEWANKKGNKEVRTILLRDPNKLVQLAVVQSPRITDGEIAKIANARTSPHEVLQHIYNNRLLLKNYTIKVSLVNNPKVPVAVAMRFLSLLRQSELKSLSKNRNVSNALQAQAKKLLEKKTA